MKNNQLRSLSLLELNPITTSKSMNGKTLMLSQKLIFRLLFLCLIFLVFTTKSFTQNNLAPGDLAIVSYQSDPDPTNTFNPALLEFDDRFSIVVLKPGGLTAGTVIYITDRGWDGPNNIWLDEAYPPFTFGIGSEAVIKWVVPAGGIIQGKEVFFIGKYHDELAPGSEYYQWFAYSNENGTVPLGTITNETPIVPTMLPQPNGFTDGMSLFNAGDNILIFQTGPPAGPATNYNDVTRRFITAILANIRPTNVGTPTSYAAWDVAPNVQNESSIPPGLVNGTTCFLMSPGPLPYPTSPVPGTVEPDNGKFSNCALSSAGACTALQMAAIIYNIANWTYSNTVFPVTTSSSFCTYNILPNNTVTLSSAAGTNAQTVCINTAITPITYNTTGATGATVTGLPAGVSGSWAANVVTITGTPTVAGAALTYTVTLTGGCGTVTTTGTIAVTANNTAGAASSTPTVCVNTAISPNITIATTGATGIGAPTGLPAGVSAVWAANVITISGTPTTTVGSPFSYSIPLTGGCGSVNAMGTITVNPVNTVTLSSAAGTNAQTVAINTPITNITYNTTGATSATVTGLPPGVTGSWAANVVTISGSPSSAAGSPYTYTVTLTGGCGTVTTTGTITVTTCTITLTSAAGTNAQTVCINTPITNITYATVGATGATFSGLPAGVTGNWVADVITISGTPTTTVGSPFNYTITQVGGSCAGTTATGTIMVNPNNTITLTSAAGTNAQTVCINTPITNITYSTTGATGATFSGLPAGVTGAWAANVVTISGSPTTTVSSPFSYTVTLTGGCGTVTTTGTIAVNPLNTITLTSGAGTNAQTVTINSAITNITYSTTGATGATFSGLPTGVTGNWAANVVTISGSPSTAVGSPFSYTVTLTGGCGTITATGSIAVNPCTTPTVTCPGNISLNNTTNTCGRVVTYTTTSGGTPAPTVTYAFTGATTASGSGNGSGSTFNVGVTNVTVTATNTCMGIALAVCSFSVNITDNQPPNVTAGTIGSCYPSVSAAQAAALAATSATDNCPGTITKTASTVGTCSAVITVTATDAAMNATPVTYNTRIDNTAPTVTVGTIASCYQTVSAAEAAALAATSATDNCPGALTKVASTVGTCAAVVTVTTTDGCGNATAVTYNTRIDNTAPTVTVGTIGSCYPTVAAAEAAALAATSATDNCSGALTETSSTVGTCSAVITVTTTDGCNATAVTYNTRIDNTAPTVTVGTIGSCYPSVPAAETAALAATSATDNCPGTLNKTASTVGTCSAVITVTTTDGCGNATAVTYNTRIDNTAPTVTVGTIGSCYPTVAAAQAAALAATSATDNCPGALTKVASTVGTCSAVVTVTTTDGCGNATAVTYNTRIDNTAPTVTVGTIASCYPTVAAAEAAALAATSATDNCPGALTEVASTVGTCSAVVTVTTTDGCGNATAVTYNTRIDNTAPTVTVGTIGSCYPTVAAAQTAALAATSATDNCPGALTKVASTVGTCSAVVTVTTTDGCGNATAVTYNTRIDNTPPTITCPDPIIVCDPSNVPTPNPALVTASDNCPGLVTVTHIGDVNNCPSCINTQYTITRTYRATDACGNFAECTQLITVRILSTAPTGISGTTTICQSNSTTLTLVGGSAGTGAVAEWFTGSCGGTSAGTGNSITVSPTTTTTYFVRYKGTCNTTTCASVTVIVNTPSVGGTVAPANSQGCGPQTVNLSVSGINGTVTQWERQTNCTGAWASIGNAGLTTITVTTPNSSTCYRAVITNGVCPSANSTVSTITVDKPAVGGRVTLQSNQTATSIALCPSQNALLIPLGFTGKVATWQYSFGTSSIWYDLPGTAGQTTLTVNGSTISGTVFYRVVIVTELGICTGAASLAYSTAFRITKKAGCLSPDGSITNTEFTTGKGFTVTKAYPNPASDLISLELENFTEGSAQIDILDVTGRQVLKLTTSLTEGFNTISLDISHLSRGIFIVKMTDSKNQKAMVKVVKE